MPFNCTAVHGRALTCITCHHNVLHHITLQCIKTQPVTVIIQHGKYIKITTQEAQHTTSHHNMSHNNVLHQTLCISLNYITPQCSGRRDGMLWMLRLGTLSILSWQGCALHNSTLRHMTLRHTTFMALDWHAWSYITCHSITLHDMALHCVVLQHGTLHHSIFH